MFGVYVIFEFWGPRQERGKKRCGTSLFLSLSASASIPSS
jgi:hypothetical protein